MRVMPQCLTGTLLMSEGAGTAGSFQVQTEKKCFRICVVRTYSLKNYIAGPWQDAVVCKLMRSYRISLVVWRPKRKLERGEREYAIPYHSWACKYVYFYIANFLKFTHITSFHL